jgi:tRNA pseudouridine55 synthase
MNKPRRIKRAISGVLLLDKPLGLSSNQALQKVRWLYSAAKGGHTGNLDPLATGLLPICLGEATKFSQRLLDADKTYLADICLGQATVTGDAEGEITSTGRADFSRAEIDTVLTRFIGPQQQIPPMYSALKFQGKALYELARQGIEIERTPRDIQIFSLRVHSWQSPRLSLEVECSKGTYIRVLAEDIGRALGSCAHLAGLRRTRTAGFALQDAITLEALEALDLTERDALLQGAQVLLPDLPDWVLHDADAAHYFCNGQPVWQARMAHRGEVKVYAPDHRFLGLAEVDDDGRLAPRRLVLPDTQANY